MGWAAYYSDFKDIVLFLLAIFAATLSAVNFIRAARKERRSLRVAASTAMPTYGPKVGPPYMKLEAINDGHRVVAVNLLTVELPDKRRLATLVRDSFPGMPDTRLPARLGEGESASVFLSYADIGTALLSRVITSKTKLTPVCEDTVGSRYIGEPWDV